MSTVEEVIRTTYTRDQCEKRYQSMIRDCAAGRRHGIDPAIVEASGRFMVDAERDLAIARRRYAAVADIEAARARLTELRANLPVPPPNRETPLSEFETLGELALAVMFLNSPNALWGPKVDHDHAITEAEAAIKRAVGHLRATSALSIDESIRAARATIERTHQASDARVQLQERLATIKVLLDGANPRSDEARAAILSQRAEHVQLKKQLEKLPDVDREAAARAGDEIEKLAASQLLPENLQFSDPSGKQPGVFAVPCRFA